MIQVCPPRVLYTFFFFWSNDFLSLQEQQELYSTHIYTLQQRVQGKKGPHTL